MDGIKKTTIEQDDLFLTTVTTPNGSEAEALQVWLFAANLRNPLEHGLRALSDLLQAGLKGLGSLLPELGWTPPEGWDKDLGKS
jgi:hypothetical protein